MSTQSSIEWTDTTWNPVRGCSKVSAGCTNCYAMRQAHRFSGPGKPYEGLTRLVPGKGPQWSGTVRTVPELLTDPLRWRRPRRVFVNSMSDLFHPDVPLEFVDRVFAVMAMTPQHIYQILTKRPVRMSEYIRGVGLGRSTVEEGLDLRGRQVQRMVDRLIDTSGLDTHESAGVWEWPLPNAWLGTSVEDQAAADERIPHLLRTPAAVRFLSCEPLLGPVDLRQRWKDYLEGWDTDAVCCRRTDPWGGCCGSPDPAQVQTERIDWVIVGGESGPGARWCDVAWIRSLVGQCRRADVPAFVKQLGAKPWDSAGGAGAYTQVFHLRDRKGGDPDEWPEDLRVREFPEGRVYA